MLVTGPVYYFAPEDDARTALIDAINKATKSIYIADYSFNDPEITDNLIQKYKDGLTVYLLLDSSQAKGKTEVPLVDKLKAAGIPMAVGTSPKHRIIHDKKALIDGDTVCWGSYNFTVVAEQECNTLEIVKSVDVYNEFKKMWDLDWNFVVTKEPKGLFNIPKA